MADEVNTLTLGVVTHSPELDQLGADLAAAQAEMVGALKDSSNPFYKSEYADLASVWKACRKPLTSHGLAVLQMPVTGTSVSVATMLLHKSGQWIMASCSATPKDNGPQAIGSVITYIKRYSLSGFAGVPQIDDDGEAAEKRPAPQAKPERRTEPAEPGSYDGDEGEVLVAEFKRASSKPGAPRPWNAGFVTLSNGVEGGTFNEALITFLENAHNTQKPIRYVSEPSKKDASKRTITAAQYAEEVVF